MKDESLDIKPMMQVILGIGCLAVFYATKEPIRIVDGYERTSHSYNPGDVLFLFFLNWISLIAGIGLIVIGCIGIIKYFRRK